MKFPDQVAGPTRAGWHKLTMFDSVTHSAVGRRTRRLARPLAATAVAAIVVLASVFSGTVQGTDVTLQIMGFDPDRSQLITSLMIAAVAAAMAALILPRISGPTVLGALSVAALFTQTFVGETQDALAATGSAGHFDTLGWLVTLATLVISAFVAAWAGATLALASRPALIATGASVGEMVKARRPNRRSIRRPVAFVLLLALLALTVPVFGDMVNLSPDALMLGGAGGNAVPIGPARTAASIPAKASPTLVSAATDVTGTPMPTPSPTVHASPGTKPWLAWKPGGPGRVSLINFDAPWKDGTASTLDVSVYTPSGYDPGGSLRYPVIYEAPTGFDLWGSGTGALGALDQLIATGEMPASIVVFIDSVGAPYPDTECADSFDGKMWLETFISSTVVNYIDDSFKTIRDPNARAIMGMSAGGFCAAMLLARHPDVYSTSISFSGYYDAGSGSTNARLPFGGQDNVNAHSPTVVVTGLTDEQKARLYFIVDACPIQEFYGPQAANFERILKSSNVPHLLINSTTFHGWPQVRLDFPDAMTAWSARMVIDGVW